MGRANVIGNRLWQSKMDCRGRFVLVWSICARRVGRVMENRIAFISKNKSRALAIVVTLLMLLALAPGLAFAAAAPTPGFDPVSISEGEPVTITWDYSVTPYQGTVVSVDGSGVIPNTFLLWVEKPAAVTAISPATATYQYDSADGSSSAYLVDISSLAAAQRILDVVVSGTSGGVDDGEYVVTSPPPNAAAGGTTPNIANGYLIGISQYATSTAWGSISTDGANSLADPTKLKIINGYSSTGVSLGSLGGYAEFQFSTPVTNTVTNPYGVDFIVYGNAFSGNPEAGIVQVAQDLDNDGVPDEWYELAGSRYYESDTVLNETVQYSLVTGGVNVSENSGTATSFTTSTSWWPYYANLNHGATSGIGGTAVNINGYQYVDFPNTDTTITYTGLTKVPFNNSTDYYQFGYSDVHANGARYGTAVNPYTIAAGDSGGDGYDISWAVDIPTGEPVALGSISFVRVYTGVLRNVGVVGETSTEVCGVYTAVGTGSGAEATPLIQYGTLNPTITLPTTNMGTEQIQFTGSTIRFSVTGSNNSNIYVNSQLVTSGQVLSYPIASGTTVALRVIVQDGDNSPYLTLVKFTRP
jgi:hypothetical protein